jgi:TPR repeat protein
MKANRLKWYLLFFLVGAVFQSPAQQSEADRDPPADVRAKAEKGDAVAQFILGGHYDLGEGVAKDEVEAVKWYRKAAEQNLPAAQRTLGLCLARGSGVAKDYVEAVNWFHKAADQNDAMAQYSLGVSYLKGQGVAKSEEEAVKWYRKAAEQNYASAQYSLGICHAKGQGLAKDEEEAVKWFRKAAVQNDAMAQQGLGVCYLKGQGVAKDEVEAIKWFRKAAERNDAAAQDNLGVCYLKGQGVTRDEAEAVKWFRKAAAQNDAQAQYNLGVCYSKGQGVAKDEVQAVKWYRKAAEQNYASAQNNLASCYAGGCGVPRDYAEAYMWTLLAVAQGDDTAKENMTTLEGLMTRNQIAQGKTLALSFKPGELPPAGAENSSWDVVQSRRQSSGTVFPFPENPHDTNASNSLTWLLGAYLLLMALGSPLVAWVLEKRLKARSPATRTYWWGFTFGCLRVAEAPLALGFAVEALLAGFRSRGDLFALDLALTVLLTTHAVSGWFIIRRKRWAWVVGTIFSCNIVFWVVNSIYGRNRWGEFAGEPYHSAVSEDDDYEALADATKLETQGRVQEALAAYQRVADRYSHTTVGGDAQKSIESLRAKIG